MVEFLFKARALQIARQQEIARTRDFTEGEFLVSIFGVCTMRINSSRSDGDFGKDSPACSGAFNGVSQPAAQALRVVVMWSSVVGNGS
jgi:hypothetical protein